MHKLPHSDGPSQWINLIAFLGVLTLAGVLLVLGHLTAGSLATVCAALGGLFADWKHLHSKSGPPPPSEDDTEGKPQ